jgi:hypothetical protein
MKTVAIKLSEKVKNEEWSFLEEIEGEHNKASSACNDFGNEGQFRDEMERQRRIVQIPRINLSDLFLYGFQWSRRGHHQ